jgi:hypothetical protein
MNATFATLILFVLVFLVLGAISIRRTIVKMRNERPAEQRHGEHILAVPDLGTTMADGGDVEKADKQARE